MNKKVLVFAGTKEGKVISQFLCDNNVDTTAATATEYGELCLENIDGLKTLCGRMVIEEITKTVKSFDIVVDATHPYAYVVSDNIRQACENTNIKRVRIVRDMQKVKENENVLRFDNLHTACEFLKTQSGNILATTGSKELEPFTNIENYKSRVFLRVLPICSSIIKCEEYGFSTSNIIAIKGPFNEQMNIAMIKSTDAKFLITKDTGKTGGFFEKHSAAQKLGIKLVIINRPCCDKGFCIEEAQSNLAQLCGFEYNAQDVNFNDTPLKLVSKNDETTKSHFPLFFNLKDKKILFIGGGNIAKRRIKAISGFGAFIKVVAPNIDDGILSFVEKSQCLNRTFEESDIDGVDFVFCTTNEKELNEKIAIMCKEKKTPVNTCDNPKLCDFYFPAIIEDKNILCGMVSKDGESHKEVRNKAQIIREALE